MSFTTQIADGDGNIYTTVTIGSQTWIRENLKTTKYPNGDLIGTTTPATLDISSETSPKYQWAYEGDDINVLIYGRLYTWYAATDSRKICPVGWHIPNDTEWTILITYLCGGGIAGGKLKKQEHPIGKDQIKEQPMRVFLQLLGLAAGVTISVI
jgi:uncharacterized protein (TIGR02145 family)